MMDFNLYIILFLVIVAPLWIIFHYSTAWKRSKTLTARDEALLDDLHKQAEKLDSRLASIERILDDEIPEWRREGHDDV